MELERAEFQNGDIVFFHQRHITEKRAPDITAEMHRIAGGFQKLRDHGRRRGFTVAARNRDRPAGTKQEKDLHLGRDDAPLFSGGKKILVKGHQARRTENKILVEPFQIRLAQLQLRMERDQLFPVPAKYVKRALVTNGNMASVFKKQTDQRHIADARADHGDALIPNRLYVFLKSQNYHLITFEL